MRKFLRSLLLPAFLASTVFVPSIAQAANLATVPIGRNDLGWWHLRFIQSLSQAKEHPNARIVWLGDSITQYWQRMGTLGYDNILPIWNEYYAPYDALDFGFVGDTTSSLIWRLDHGQVDGLHPRLAIILIGANNLGRVHWPASCPRSAPSGWISRPPSSTPLWPPLTPTARLSPSSMSARRCCVTASPTPRFMSTPKWCRPNPLCTRTPPAWPALPPLSSRT
jgi:hypothetical protein